MVNKTKLLEIAQRHLGFDSFNAFNRDKLDFKEVAVWNVERALVEAYELGQREGRGHGVGDQEQ
jgi:hypothetical protein